MSTDGFIFERKSKRYYSYDRDYNMFALAVSEYLPKELEDKAGQIDDIRYALMKDGAKVPAAQVIEWCDYLIQGWAAAPELRDRERLHAAFNVKQFAEAFPDGEFFVRMDNDDAYDLLKDMHGKPWREGYGDAGEYSEWTP